MVEFRGRPFLDYLVRLLRDQGFDHILMLLGYLPDVILDHFGDGSRLGVHISYTVTPPDMLTWQRMHDAADQLEQNFLLLYCDNYWPMRFSTMWERYAMSRAPAMVTVYRNTDGYTRSNVQVTNGRVTVFDKTRTQDGLSGVEIGYALIDKSVLALQPADVPAMFEEAVYPALAARGHLLAHVTNHRYYSVGTIARLQATDTFFSSPFTVFLD